ncbi:DsbA family oxidoreductase [Heliophilum fasciatum]|uniref:Putative DsbA family dithiol-disulfide isomerase n=1 Tax=Heliophilum fasciatum TaxID=35700 RepID=A0A4R2RUS9_9FIRM|nr:DsbA family protein [Heliophilum fasciatum]MCW2277243.1 putative DsbA family dithiol-disulfide isomerase [Heliophilum fasciatum]TCP68122.1 putative DsbA family dithiol-disulfide isomerase [Heliophilum fasciatum]
MNKVTVEFFHDVICSFCFPMSYRMRQLQKMMPEVQIVHRSYALVKSERDFDEMFGSRAAAKAEILSHWEQANQNDDLHRFNISGMYQADFPFPTSLKALTACKAAYFTAGDAGYWDVFDALQHALFVQNRNIEERDIINDCIRQSGIDFATWEQHYNSDDTKEAVEKDLILAKQYGVHAVPCLIIEGKYRISGAQPLAQIIQAIGSAVETQEQTPPAGASCRLDGSKIKCD